MILGTIGYGILGIILMILGFIVIDLVTPYKFMREIFEEKNPAAGIIVAGLFIAIAIIIRSAIIGG